MTTIFTRVAVLGIAGLAFSVLPAAAFAATPDASFDETSLTTTSTKPKLSGDAEDVRTVRLVIENEDGKRVFRSRETRVRNDEWKIRVTKKLKKGTYEVSLVGPKSIDNEVLATSTLTIGTEKPKASERKNSGKKEGTVYLSRIPLLIGGTGMGGASVPVAYVKVGNPSKEDVSIDGFTLTQYGSADTDAIVSFSTSDDHGGSLSTSESAFKNGAAFVPLTATLAPGEVRIYSIKAQLARSLAAHSGKTLKLDVTGADLSANISSKFPIKGTTWTLSR